jgi:hypothetical protein
MTMRASKMRVFIIVRRPKRRVSRSSSGAQGPTALPSSSSTRIRLEAMGAVSW